MTDVDVEGSVRPSLWAMCWAMLTLGLVSFGGNNAMIMGEMVVERRKWLSAADMDQAIAAATMAPGGNSSNLSYEVGRRVRGVPGGLVSYASMAIPGIIIALVVGTFLISMDGRGRATGLLNGAQAAAVALVGATVIRLGRRSFHRPLDWVVAAVLLVMVGVLRWPIELCVPPVVAVAWIARRRGA